MTAADAQGGAHGPPLRNRNFDIVRNGLGRAVDRLLPDLPGGPVGRFVLGEHRQPESPAFLHQFTVRTLVDDGSDVAVGVERQFVNAIFKAVRRRLQRRPGRRPLHAQVVDGIPHRPDLGGKGYAHPTVFIAENLHRHPFAARRPRRHAARLGSRGDLRLDDLPAGLGNGIIDDHRRSLHPRVQRTGNTARGRGRKVGELVLRDQLVVPRKGVGARDARTREVVVELMPDEAAPLRTQFFGRIGRGAQPVGHNRGALGDIGELFVAAVEAFHRCLGGVAARRMDIHEQFSVVDRQFGMFVEGMVILVDLSGAGADDLQRAVAANALLQGNQCRDRRRAAAVPHAVVSVGRIVHSTFGQSDDPLVTAHVTAAPARVVVVGIQSRHQARPVDALPKPDRKGHFRLPVKGMLAPLEFLGREPDQPGMCGDRRQRIAEPETVGQENVVRLHAELLAVEPLPQQDVAEKRLRRGNVGVGGVPRTAADVPAAAADPLLHLSVQVGIVLLHPTVLNTSFEVENIVGIAFQQPEVLDHRIADVNLDRSLYVPVPLRIEMRVGNHIGLVFLLRIKPLCENAQQSAKNQRLFHGYSGIRSR